MISAKLVHHFRDITDYWDESPFQNVEEAWIDESTHTIKNVCIFGTRYSKNGYTYQDNAIASLTKFADGAKFFINHPSKSEAKDRDGVRDIRDWAGVYNKPVRQGERVFSDLTVRPAYWDLVKDVAMLKPAGIGNSINSRVKVFKDGQGKEHVVDIDVLKSIDLVASAATTKNLFESALEKSAADIDMKIDSVLNEKDTTIQGNLVYDLIAERAEGILMDKIKERETARKVNDLNWKASDLIDSIIRDEKKGMKNKKEEITGILDDLDKQINLILSGKKVETEEKHKTKEEDDMDLTKLSLEDLSKERPDLVKAIKDSHENAEKFAGMEKENVTLKKANEDMSKQVGELNAKIEGLAKELTDTKKKLDEYETKAKASKKEAFIATKMEELKVPKEAITDFFKTDLMSKEDKDIEEALKDRKELFLKGKGGVKNNGQEYSQEVTEGVTDEKKKSAAAKLAAATK